MMKGIIRFIAITVAVFVVLVAMLALRATPGKNPIAHRITCISWSPGIPVAKLIGNARIRPWPTEKGGFPSAFLLGGLGLFASAVWAGGGMVLWASGKRIMKRMPNHTPESIRRLADGSPKLSV